MVLPGAAIPTSNKRKRRTPAAPARPPPGSALQQLADLEAGEAVASQARILALDNAAPNDRPAAHDDNHHGGEVYNNLQRAGDMDNFPAANEVHQEHPPLTRSAYYQSVTYQERALREEAHWRDVIPALFLAYMPCALQTHQWGDEGLWNHDWIPACKCATWQRGRAEIDAVDIISKLHKPPILCCVDSDKNLHLQVAIRSCLIPVPVLWISLD